MKKDIQSFKKALEQENSDLKYWLSYIRWRATNHWAGMDQTFCTADIENIMLRIENDLFLSSLNKETTMHRSKA
tara:strand:- start:585 stop:806 length:222 start_codon:yes stop_codon:yes gene_type:complete